MFTLRRTGAQFACEVGIVNLRQYLMTLWTIPSLLSLGSPRLNESIGYQSSTNYFSVVVSGW